MAYEGITSVINKTVSTNLRIFGEKVETLNPSGQPIAVAKIPTENAQPKVRSTTANESTSTVTFEGTVKFNKSATAGITKITVATTIARKSTRRLFCTRFFQSLHDMFYRFISAFCSSNKINLQWIMYE